MEVTEVAQPDNLKETASLALCLRFNRTSLVVS